MSLEAQLLDRQIDVRDGLDFRKQRALAEFLTNQEHAREVAQEIQNNPEFSRVLEALWKGATENLDRRIQSFDSLVKFENLHQTLRGAQERTNTELQTLFTATQSLASVGINVSEAQQKLSSLAQKFVHFSTAENNKNATAENVWEEKKVTIQVRGGERQITKREIIGTRNPGIEASINLIKPILETKTCQQTVDWLKEIHTWNNSVLASKDFLSALHQQILEKIIRSQDLDALLNFQQAIAGKNPEIEKRIQDLGVLPQPSL